tara:strand:- start:30 stop:830 length:801 start_codon:yes stop_codon:yes gene_type:complete
MKNEVKKETSPINKASSNVNLTTHLTLALKNTASIMKVLMPKIAVSVKDLILEFKKLTEKNTETDEKKSQIQMKALREHCYDLVAYNRKVEKNEAFETVVTRAIKLGLMLVDHANEFDVDTKNSQIFVMSKIATPFKVEKLEGQVASESKSPNDSEKLVQVNTGVIDRVFHVKYGGKKRTPKTLDTKIPLTLKDTSKSFYKLFEKAINQAVKGDVKFFTSVDESVMEQLSLIDTLFNSPQYKTMRKFSLEKREGIDGKLEDVLKTA